MIRKEREYHVVICTSEANFNEKVIAKSKYEAAFKAFSSFTRNLQIIKIKERSYKKLLSSIKNHSQLFKIMCEGESFFCKSAACNSFVQEREEGYERDLQDRNFDF